MCKGIAFFCCCFLCFFVNAQKKNEQFEISIKKIVSPIKIDGQMDEADWFNAAAAKDFYMVLPMDTSMAKVRTEVRMAYDDKHLYLLAVCYTALPGPYMVESLRRDFAFGKNDNFLLLKIRNKFSSVSVK